MNKVCPVCNTEFTTDNPKRIYCGNVCQRDGQKESQERYQKRKKYENRMTKQRKCVHCQTDLSIYNDNNYCGACEKKGLRGSRIWVCECHGASTKKPCSKAREVGWFSKSPASKAGGV